MCASENLTGQPIVSGRGVLGKERRDVEKGCACFDASFPRIHHAYDTSLSTHSFFSFRSVARRHRVAGEEEEDTKTTLHETQLKGFYLFIFPFMMNSKHIISQTCNQISDHGQQREIDTDFFIFFFHHRPPFYRQGPPPLPPRRPPRHQLRRALLPRRHPRR